MCKCAYTTIEYYPKSFNNESINIAFILHDATTGKLFFKKIKNKKRVLNFDDELDSKDFDFVIGSFERFLKKPFDIDSSDNRINDINYLNSIGNAFLNEFRLSNIQLIESNEPYETFEEMSKLVLYFDYEKESRPKKEEIDKIIKKTIKSYLCDKKVDFKESYDVNDITLGEPVKVDFKIGNTFIKVLDFKMDSYTSKINTAKIWAFNSYYFSSKEYNLIVALVGKAETQQEKTYLSILEQSNIKICYINELDSLLMSV